MAYARFGWYWGLGVEHETYVLSSQTRTIKTFEGALKPERYSVSYYQNYNQEVLPRALKEVLDASGGSLTIPVILNCHSFMDCDVFGEHQTTYEKVPKPNPRFAGRTMFEWATEHSAWLRDEFGRVFMWDGDTVEFMTERFYRATVGAVIQELVDGEERFVREIQSLPRSGILTAYGPLRLAAPRNEPWATHLTNPRAVSMFNNGTIHINLTLPTRLGWGRRPMWPADFLEKHRQLARLIQWVEPLWIAAHGSGDPFATRATTLGDKFAAGSQRLAVSRYIGVGTFDTERMPVGKILQIPRVAGAYPWYDWLHARTAYAPLDVVGLDLNYNKHWAHGLELRFFDQFPIEELRRVMEQLAVLCDVALEGWIVPAPQRCVQWQRAAGDALYEGSGWRVTPEQLNAICAALRIAQSVKEPMNSGRALEWLFEQLQGRRAYCWRVMVEGDAVGCCG
jgi:hypothetical protein